MVAPLEAQKTEPQVTFRRGKGTSTGERVLKVCRGVEGPRYQRIQMEGDVQGGHPCWGERDQYSKSHSAGGRLETHKKKSDCVKGDLNQA